MIWRLIRRKFRYLRNRSRNWIAGWRSTGEIPARSRRGRQFSSASLAERWAVSELVFLFSADADIQGAFEFYERYQPGRGEFFMRCLDIAFGQIRAFPEMAPLFHGPYRRLLVRGLPYGIFYTIEGGRMVVSGIMDSVRTRKAFAGDLANSRTKNPLIVAKS